VHASVAPSWSRAQALAAARAAGMRLATPDRAAVAGELRERDDALGRLTSARSALSNGGWSSQAPETVAGAEPWHAAWARAAHDYGVVYGHWAMQGLHVAPQLRGLDTGCVHHGRDHDGFLTAWLPDPRARDPFAAPDEHFWQERAHRRYYRG
jgi:bis(5'-nucleosyl)-tetraphosphatase (symmetrical)